MIPFFFNNQPIILLVSILLLLFHHSQSSLHINHTTTFTNPDTNRLDREHQSQKGSFTRLRDTTSSPIIMPTKKLLRLPHIFNQVLELPLASHADVFIEDRNDSMRFVAHVDVKVVKVHVVKICAGVMKVVVRGGGEQGELLDKLEVDVWRFRLPGDMRLELTSAVVVGGELVVMVPKGGKGRGGYGGKVDDARGVWGGG